MFGSLDRYAVHLAGFALVSTSLSSGCNALDFAPLVTATSTVSKEFQTGPEPKIVVESFNGSIDVSDGENNEVVAEVTSRAGGFDQQAAERNLEAVEVTMEQKGDTIHVTARLIGPRLSNCGASVVIAAPKAARLQLKSSNGPIVCEGMQGGIDALTSNAKVDVTEGRGEIEVVTSNGRIEIEASDALVDAHTSNAKIEFRGSLAGKEHRFKSSNGKIELHLPPQSQFEIDCSTSNGSVQCDFPVTNRSRANRRKLAGTVGDNPTLAISASTSNAGIVIRKLPAE